MNAQITHITQLPAEIICHIASYLTPTDYERLRETNRTMRDTLLSIGNMRSALWSQCCSGLIEKRYRTLVGAKQIDVSFDSLSPEELYGLQHIRVQYEFQVSGCISIMIRYPCIAFGENDMVQTVAANLIDALETLSTRQQGSGHEPFPKFASSYSVSNPEAYPDDFNHACLYINDARTYSHIADIFACAQRMGDGADRKIQLCLATIMVMLAQFLCQHPPGNLCVSEIDRTLSDYAPLLRTGRYVQEKLAAQR